LQPSKSVVFHDLGTMHRWTALTCAAVLGALLAVPAQAQWKWRDKNGQTQYSDLPPPPGIAESDILQRPAAAQRVTRAAAPAASGAASGPPALAPKGIDPELEAKRRKTEQEAAAKKKAEDEKVAIAKADNCLRAKAQARTLDSGMRIARTNEKGEREFLDDAGRAAEAKRAQDIIASDCK
jgi:hypothetical protein